MPKKCLNCGYERQPEDESEFTPASECPKCHAIYEKVETWLKEKEKGDQIKNERFPLIPASPSGAIRDEVAYACDRIDAPGKSFSINQNQKRILIAVISVFVAMIAYPPFHVIGVNGAVFNMGYGWIFDPPKRGYMTATVNVSMLLIQWICVLVVGGIAFFLTKGVSLSHRSSSQQSFAKKHGCKAGLKMQLRRGRAPPKKNRWKMLIVCTKP